MTTHEERLSADVKALKKAGFTVLESRWDDDGYSEGVCSWWTQTTYWLLGVPFGIVSLHFVDLKDEDDDQYRIVEDRDGQSIDDKIYSDIETAIHVMRKEMQYLADANRQSL